MSQGRSGASLDSHGNVGTIAIKFKKARLKGTEMRYGDSGGSRDCAGSSFKQANKEDARLASLGGDSAVTASTRAGRSIGASSSSHSSSHSGPRRMTIYEYLSEPPVCLTIYYNSTWNLQELGLISRPGMDDDEDVKPRKKRKLKAAKPEKGVAAAQTEQDEDEEEDEVTIDLT